MGPSSQGALSWRPDSDHPQLRRQQILHTSETHKSSAMDDGAALNSCVHGARSASRAASMSGSGE